MNSTYRKAADKVQIFSRSGQPFSNRLEAGQLLAEKMVDLKGQNSVVLGIPRGGIVVARGLARGIDADLDIVLSRKLGAPGHSELAVGALAENGELYLNRYVMEELSVSDAYFQQEKSRQMAEIRRRSRLMRDAAPKISLNGRIVIITDDGVATGSTMQAAVWAVRKENPEKLVVAIPVASEEAISRLSEDVDELLCLRMPDYFMAVGQFYSEFEQVTDEQVVDILSQERARRARK
jgi:putative phosphoribosyl transferase